ncbi:MAG: hypothetical protein ABI977_29740 [Acidobacteriota bacterium]
MHLVLIETSGNQNYIFATNKLRENVGASELTYRVGTEWVLNAVKRNGGADLWDEKADQLRINLFNQSGKSQQGGIEVILATSGKAMLLVETEQIGKQIVREVTRQALQDAPGIDVCGIISNSFDWNQPLGGIVNQTHKQLEQTRAHRPGAAMRFLRLPVVRECATSGLPAAEWDPGIPNGEPPAPRSKLSLNKRGSIGSYKTRMGKLLSRKNIKGNFAANIDELEKYCDWLAVVHADGNGVGQIFRDFWENSGCKARLESEETVEDVNREYVNLYRKFSIALDVCTEEAFTFALKSLLKWKDKLRSLQRIKENRDDVLPILPILLGGDDLTLVCDGQAALQFTRDFLIEFEKQTATLQTENKELQRELSGVIPRIAEKALNIPQLSASAGVAIVKPHFPFSAAYHLAEQLTISAKKMRPHSALDFHALYDASGSNLDRIREKLQCDEGKTRLYGRPYVVTPSSSPQDDQAKVRLHDWRKLEARIKVIFAKDDDGRRLLPNSQLHDLRSGLFLGKNGAGARYQLIRQRYKEQGITAFDEEGEDGRKSLFFIEGGISRTRLLDALDAANFWVETDEEGENGQSKEDAQ